jgi:hypothetical protein
LLPKERRQRRNTRYAIRERHVSPKPHAQLANSKDRAGRVAGKLGRCRLGAGFADAEIYRDWDDGEKWLMVAK